MSEAREIPEGFASVSEGEATILQQGNSVFYNKAQVVNRDISNAVLRWFIQQRQLEKTRPKRTHKPKMPDITPFKKGVEGISILEAMAATGLRAIRYAKEVAGIGQVIANDMDSDAVQSMRRNVQFNGVQDKVTPNESDARLTMLQHSQVFDVVDLDPYGSPNILLDSAVQSVAENGLLMVTATDMAVLCGNTAEACYAKYGSYSLHKEYCHEQALRILLACVAQHAARHKRVVEPVLCLSIDFYVRLFMRVRSSPSEAKHTATKLSYVWQSTGCDSWWLQPVGMAHGKGDSLKFQAGRGPAVPEKCPVSGGKFSMGGPIWNGPLMADEHVTSIFKQIEANEAQYPSHAKLLGLLRAVREELPDAPLYYTLSGLCRTVKCSSPKMNVLRDAIVNAGFRASNTHCSAEGVKTDAPPEVVWDIMRHWVQKNPVRIADKDSYQAKILAVEPKLDVSFASTQGVMSRSKADRKARFVQNPENWGPRPKHGRPVLPHEREIEQAVQACDPAAGLQSKKQKL